MVALRKKVLGFFFFGEQREVWFQKLNVEVWVTTNVDVNFNIINGSFD